MEAAVSQSAAHVKGRWLAIVYVTIDQSLSDCAMALRGPVDVIDDKWGMQAVFARRDAICFVTVMSKSITVRKLDVSKLIKKKQ